MFIKISIILTGSEFPIFLVNKEEWRCHWRLRWPDITFFQVFLYEFVQFNLFLRCQIICLEIFGHKCILHLNFVIPWSRFRKLCCLFLLQNILFLEGAGTFLRKSPKPLQTSKCVHFRQFCTKLFASFCVVFIKTFWTFLSLRNIYLKKGTAYLNLMRALLLILLRNIIETASLMGTKGSMISQLLHQSYYFWTHESGC